MNSEEFLTCINLALKENGFIHLRQPNINAGEICKKLGMVISVENIRVDKSKNRVYNLPDKIPYHSDHPAAKIIIWECKENEKIEKEGSIDLIDLRLLLEKFVDFEIFQEIYFTVPEIAGIKYDGAVQLLKIQGIKKSIFYADWLKKDFISDKHEKAFCDLQKAVENSTPISIRIAKGDIVIIDNHRMIHGRNKIASKSKRHLLRYWIM